MRPIRDIPVWLVGMTWDKEDTHTFLEYQGKLRELPQVFLMALIIYFCNNFFLCRYAAM